MGHQLVGQGVDNIFEGGGPRGLGPLKTLDYPDFVVLGLVRVLFMHNGFLKSYTYATAQGTCIFIILGFIHYSLMRSADLHVGIEFMRHTGREITEKTNSLGASLFPILPAPETVAS